MQDRVPLYPGRVTLTPVSGQANTFDLVRADQPTQEGTPLDKATLLKDVTAALYGLGTGAVPDDVLAELGKYKQYWWRRRTPSKTQYVEKLTNVTADAENSGIPSYGTTVYVSNTIYFDPTTGGDITLVNPEEVVLDSWDSESTGAVQVSKITAKAPCYLKVRNVASEKTYYLPTGSTATVWYGGNGTMQVRYQDNAKSVKFGRSSSVPVIAKVVTNELGNIPAGDWEYLQSSTRSAYPDSGTSGGYEYEYLGIPLDNAVTAPKIATGFYKGTGTYDSQNKTSITFPFAPKWLMIYDKSFASYAFWNDLMTSPMTTHINYTTGRSATFSFDGFTLSWYAENAPSQLNTENRIFYYIAIG